MKARSPIERMIDAACGYDATDAKPKIYRGFPRLRCPKCEREQNTALDKSDPKGAMLVVVCCPKCCGDFEEIHYFDKAGNELFP